MVGALVFHNSAFAGSVHIQVIGVGPLQIGRDHWSHCLSSTGWFVVSFIHTDFWLIHVRLYFGHFAQAPLCKVKKSNTILILVYI